MRSIGSAEEPWIVNLGEFSADLRAWQVSKVGKFG